MKISLSNSERSKEDHLLQGKVPYSNSTIPKSTLVRVPPHCSLENDAGHILFCRK
jgi:hypothetical protein